MKRKGGARARGSKSNVLSVESSLESSGEESTAQASISGCRLRDSRFMHKGMPGRREGFGVCCLMVRAWGLVLVVWCSWIQVEGFDFGFRGSDEWTKREPGAFVR